MKIPRIILLPACFCLLLSAAAQISEGGTPASFRYASILGENIPVEAMPVFNLDSIQQEDRVNDKRKDIPWRFGFNFTVNFNLSNSGRWEEVGNGNRIWRLKISSKNALSLNLIFGNYQIPEGGKVFLYNEAKTYLLGAFTEKNNQPHHILGVDLIPGDALIAEYFEPYSARGRGILEISQVTHGYRGNPDLTKDFGSSGSCNNNVVCPEGAPWQDQIRATAMNLVNGNTWCSGALINNTCRDGKPYYLTADHCLSGSVAAWVFRFNYESPVCTPNTDGPYNFTVSGATLKAHNNASDFALLELSSAPPDTFNVFYAGWDRSGAVPQKQVGIHHPGGDVKKISFDEEPAVDTTNFGVNVWQISSWNDGTTEGGSSGSPLFDQNQRIVGQLYGGSASCSSLSDDNYGKFSVSWDFGGSSSTQLKDWLDACGTGEITIDGYDPGQPSLALDAATSSLEGISNIYCGNTIDSLSPFAIISNKGIDTLTKVTILFGMDGTVDSLVWNGVLPTNAKDTIWLGSYFPASGNHSFSVSVKNPNDSADQKNINDSKTIPFQFITNAREAAFTLKTDNYGSETSWQIKDTSGTLWYSGGGYANMDGGETITDTLCFAPGCYAFILYDSYGDGISGNNGSGTQGTYYFINEPGDTLASIQQVNFGTQEINNFCLSDTTDSGIHFNVTSSVSCAGECTGSLQALPSFGQSPYSYQWSANTSGQQSQTSTGLCGGIYAVTISDSAGVERSSYFHLPSPSPLSSLISGTDALQDSCNGSASVIVTGGKLPYNFLWSNGQQDSVITGLCPATYFLTVTDSLGCIHTDSVFIAEAVGQYAPATPAFYATIYPNPNNGNFTIVSNDQIIDIEILNAVGKSVYRRKNNLSSEINPKDKNMTIAVDFPAGIYFIKLTGNKFFGIKTLVICR